MLQIINRSNSLKVCSFGEALSNKKHHIYLMTPDNHQDTVCLRNNIIHLKTMNICIMKIEGKEDNIILKVHILNISMLN